MDHEEQVQELSLAIRKLIFATVGEDKLVAFNNTDEFINATGICVSALSDVLSIVATGAVVKLVADGISLKEAQQTVTDTVVEVVEHDLTLIPRRIMIAQGLLRDRSGEN